MDEARDDPSCRLAVYGTLAPGQVNHHLVAELVSARGSVTIPTREDARSSPTRLVARIDVQRRDFRK